MQIVFWQRTPARSDAIADAMRWDDALDFWQKEVHYYESRAGDQGASAHRMVTIAAGATALIPVVGNSVQTPLVINGLDIRLSLYVVPAVILLLWATAVRLLHEMALLREYRYHAELQVLKLMQGDRRLDGYLPWERASARYDRPQPITLTWAVLAGAISLTGVLGVLWAMNGLMLSVGGWWWALPWMIAIIFAVLLLVSGLRNGSNAEKLARELGNPELKQRQKAFASLAWVELDTQRPTAR